MMLLCKTVFIKCITLIMLILIWDQIYRYEASPMAQWVKNPPAMQEMGDVGLIPGLGRSSLWSRKWQPTPVFLPGESDGQRSLWAIVHSATKSWTCLERLSMNTNLQKCLRRNLGWAIFDNLCLSQKKRHWWWVPRGLVWSYFLVWMMILLKPGPALSTVDAVIFWFLWFYSGSRKTQHFSGVLLTSALIKSEIPEVPSSVILRSSC